MKYILRCLQMLFFLLWSFDANLHAQTDSQLIDFTRIESIKRLSHADANKGHPVEIVGTVIWQSSDDFVVHDGKEGIWIGLAVAQERGLWNSGEFETHKLVIGDRLKINGITDGGGYAPVILPTHLVNLGSGSLPEPLAISIDRLLSGSEDAQRIVLEGVIQDVVPGSSSSAYLPPGIRKSGSLATTPPVNFAYLMVAGHLCRIVENKGIFMDYEKWVDARVRISGVFAADYNYRSEATGMKILISDANDIKILTPPSVDPFATQEVRISGLRPFSPDAEPFHRKVTEGTVIFSVPGKFFFLQDETSSVRVETKCMDVQTGQRVKVAGFVDISEKLASLTNSQVRIIGTRQTPDPISVTIRQLMSRVNDSSWGIKAAEDFSAKKVRISGYLRRVDRRSSGEPQDLWIEQSGQFFFAHLPLSNPMTDKMKATFTEGALVELTGICELSFSDFANVDGFYQPNGFRLWLASPADVRMLDHAPWWTAKKLWYAFGSVAALLALTLIWSFSLRTILKRRTTRLEEVMQVHRNSELEYSGARRERQRLASDLHDGMQQMLVGASYRLEAASAEMGDVPLAVERQLQAARRAMAGAQEGLRDFIWGVKHVDENISDFEALLSHAIRSIDYWPVDGVTIVSGGAPFPLSRHVMGTLLLLIQEAVGNAFKHGKAALVSITLNYTQTSLNLEIQDDGSGFDCFHVSGPVQGHFGLESMGNRMAWLGGTFNISSEPTVGTCVLCRLPKERALLDSTAV